MRKQAARVCLVVAVVWFILGAFVLGNAPEWFAISAAFAAVAASLGIRSVRISGVVLVIISVAVAVGAYEARQNLKLRVREIRQKAAEKKSSSLDGIVDPTRAFRGRERAVQVTCGSRVVGGPGRVRVSGHLPLPPPATGGG